MDNKQCFDLLSLSSYIAQEVFSNNPLCRLKYQTPVYVQGDAASQFICDDVHDAAHKVQWDQLLFNWCVLT
jgi:hypothetical protein